MDVQPNEDRHACLQLVANGSRIVGLRSDATDPHAIFPRGGFLDLCEYRIARKVVRRAHHTLRALGEEAIAAA
jgi:hypothetical protein